MTVIQFLIHQWAAQWKSVQGDSFPVQSIENKSMVSHIGILQGERKGKGKIKGWPVHPNIANAQ